MNPDPAPEEENETANPPADEPQLIKVSIATGGAVKYFFADDYAEMGLMDRTMGLVVRTVNEAGTISMHGVPWPEIEWYDAEFGHPDSSPLRDYIPKSVIGDRSGPAPDAAVASPAPKEVRTLDSGALSPIDLADWIQRLTAEGYDVEVK